MTNPTPATIYTYFQIPQIRNPAEYQKQRTEAEKLAQGIITNNGGTAREEDWFIKEISLRLYQHCCDTNTIKKLKTQKNEIASYAERREIELIDEINERNEEREQLLRTKDYLIDQCNNLQDKLQQPNRVIEELAQRVGRQKAALKRQNRQIDKLQRNNLILTNQYEQKEKELWELKAQDNAAADGSPASKEHVEEMRAHRMQRNKHTQKKYRQERINSSREMS